MKMQKIIMTLLISSFFSCSSKKQNVYDESDYLLVKIDSFEGRIDKKYFANKYDTTRLMVINYWNNGKIMMKGFVHQGRQDGTLQKYKMDGTLFAEDSFIDGKNIYSKKYYVSDTSNKIFKDGKLLPVDTVESIIK